MLSIEQDIRAKVEQAVDRGAEVKLSVIRVDNFAEKEVTSLRRATRVSGHDGDPFGDPSRFSFCETRSIARVADELNQLIQGDLDVLRRLC